MPLRDHFHPPWSEQNPWEGFHSAWVNTMVRHLNGVLLPKRFRAFPQIHLGPFVEADVSTWERTDDPAPGGTTEATGNGVTTAAWAPPEATQTLEVEFPAQDVFEVRVVDAAQATRLVAVVELVSPRNKDREESRRAFASKCAAYLQERVSLVVVDVVTSRHKNLHHELLDLFALPHDENGEDSLYAVSYRSRKGQPKWHLDTWSVTLDLNAVLPTVPLWLAVNYSVPLDLEKSYEETGRVLRIE
jgi:hypothetical protein